MKNHYDVIVIGSGFGGAITGCRLAQSGRSVCIVEKGRRWQRTEFPRSPHELESRAPWNEQRRDGLLDYRSFPRMDVIQGCGVGGGSLHYFNVAKRPPSAIFNNRWPKSINLRSLAPYYSLAKAMLTAKTLTPNGRKLPLRTQAFWEAAQAYGGQPEFVDIAVRTDIHGPHSQSACIYCGDCLLGCQVHAKNTLDLNYIREAEHCGAEVFPQHKAEAIVPRRGGYTVRVSRLKPGARDATNDIEVSARIVVVAAGTLGSNELLLKCRDVHKTLPRLSDALGKGFSGNGDYLLAGTLYGENTVVDPGSGPSITAGLKVAAEGQHIYIEDLGYSDPLLWYINASLPTEQHLQQSLLLGWDYLLSSVGLGHTTTRHVQFERLFSGGITNRFLPYLGMGTDAADGVFTLDDQDSIALSWDHSRSLPMFRLMENCLQRMSKKSGGEYIRSFLWASPINKLLTAHPLGGCALSNSERDGVVNEFGEVWNYPNLYVADGSVIPTALAANPSATISALAERTAFHITHPNRNITEEDLTARMPDACCGGSEAQAQQGGRLHHE